MSRQDVFISATSVDLNSYREVAKQALLDIGAHPVEQANFPTDYRDLSEMLARRLDPCDAVLHIVGFYYGAEPNRDAGTPRRSYTQWEYYRATDGDSPKPTYVFLARENCSFDSKPFEDAERIQLQIAHREHLKRQRAVYYEFSNHEELRTLIHRAQELRSIASRRLIRVPFRPLANRFTGRADILENLTNELTAPHSKRLKNPSVLHAGGGVGKTALAIELAWRLFDRGMFDFVFFLNASTSEALISEISSLSTASVLGLAERTEAQQQVRYEAVLNWFHLPGNAERTLVILDNADSDAAREAVNKLLPQLPGCAILITSQSTAWKITNSRNLELFTPEESRAYLRTNLDAALIGEGGTDADLDRISEAVDHLPLALELVASYLDTTHQTPTEWLTEWHASPLPTLQHHDPSVNYPVALGKIWEKSVGRLSAFACNLLYTVVWYAPRPETFPIFAFRSAENWNDLRNGFSELARSSLIYWDTRDDAISVHRLLQLVSRERLRNEDRTNTLEAALAILEAICPQPDWDEKGWGLWERLMPHLDSVFHHLAGHPSESKASKSMQQCGLWLKHQSRYAEAEVLYRRSLEIDERSLGSNHIRIAVELNNLGRLLDSTGRSEAAQVLLTQAATIAETNSDQNDRVLSMCLTSLAQVLQSRGKFDQSEALLRRVLALRREGVDVRDVAFATCLTELGSIEEQTGRLAEAEAHHAEALEIFESCLDESHPHISATLSGLSLALIAQGKLQQAKPFLDRSFSIDKKCYGEGHLHLAYSLQNLGLYHLYSREPAEAERYFRVALLLVEKDGPRDLPVTGRILTNLGSVLSAGGRHEEAELMLRRALEISERLFGPETPVVAKRLDNLAEGLCNAGKISEGEEFHRRQQKLRLKFSLVEQRENLELREGTSHYVGCLRRLGMDNDGIKKRMEQLISEVEKELFGDEIRSVDAQPRIIVNVRDGSAARSGIVGFELD